MSMILEDYFGEGDARAECADDLKGVTPLFAGDTLSKGMKFFKGPTIAPTLWL